MKKQLLVVGCWLLVAAAFVAVLIGTRSNDEGGGKTTTSGTNGADGTSGTALIEDCGAQGTARPTTPQQLGDGTEEVEEELTPEEKAEQEEERLVDEFDNLTDAWMEPATNGVAVTDVDTFMKRFASVPKDRKEECLQRALNLIPDENVMLLVGVLMDKTQDKELVELVFNDILNRDENVKKPILQQIFRDKTHPCWADVAWILDEPDEKTDKP